MLDDIGIALCVAARWEIEGVVDALTDKGASTGFIDRKEILTADFAKGRGYRDITKRLR